LASSEGSPSLPSPWEVLCKGSLSLKATLGSREVGLGEEQVSSLRGWGGRPEEGIFRIASIEALGGVIKGVDPILVNFLSFHKNRYIWLCWKEDEDTIMYWHELNEGFAGRKPIHLLEKDL